MDMNLVINIGAVVLAVGVIGLLWYKGKKKEALEVIAYLVNTAEKTYGSGTGTLKYEFVVNQVYKLLPSIVTSAIGKETIDKWIEDSVNSLQEKLEEEIKKN